MDPVVKRFVRGKPAKHSAIKSRPSVGAKGEGDQERGRRGRPCAQSEDGVRVAMMNGVERCCEGAEPMAHPSMDGVLQEAPGKEPRGEQSYDPKRRKIHTIMLRPGVTPAQRRFRDLLFRSVRRVEAALGLKDLSGSIEAFS